MATTGAIKKIYSGFITLESSGAATITNNNISAKTATADLNMASFDEPNLPHCEFYFEGDWGATPVLNSTLELILREINVGGTAAYDTLVPTTGYRPIFGVRPVKDVTTRQPIVFSVFNCPREAEVYFYNNASGITIATTWLVKARSFSFVPA